MSPDDHPTTDPPAADAPTVASRAAPAPAPRLRPGDRVGPYTIRDVLGEGGFAVVYRADQAEPVRRTVALKIIKLGMDTRQVIARFEAERQALAVMDHPNVARVLDAGATDTGRPYFVMELVAGDPITDYCDRHRLRTRERLDLFIQTCRAVQHAHQKGIIHRDIKPSNVLVTVRESDPVVKVIDFGIAKATQQQLTERTIFTEHGQFIGTPEYMSPEQAEMRALDIDTRTDIYSLGVLLYELLTATLPFDPEALRAAGYAEIQRIIREQDPPRPSTKLSSLREATTTIAQRHASDPKTLLRVLRGDLDWITMRCLEKDRTRRYESAGGLAADIRRHLDDEPVLAGPPSAGYRIGKFVRRHRGAVAAAGALVLVLALGVAGTTWGLLRAVANERVARTEAAKAQQIAAFTQEMLAGIDPATAGDLDKTLMRMVLDEAAARIGTDLADEPEVEASIRQTIGRSYVAIGEYDRAEPHLERSRELRRTVLGDEHRATLRAMNTLAGVHWRRGRYEDAAALQRETLEIQERVLGDEHPDTLASLSNLAGQYADLGRADEAEPLYARAIETLRRVLGEEHPATLDSMSSLAILHASQGRWDEAEPLYVETLEARRRVLGDEHPSTLESLNNLAVMRWRQGRQDEAERLYERALDARRRVLGEEHPTTLRTMKNLAVAYETGGRYDEAEPLHLEALAIQRRVLGEEHPDTLRSMHSLAMMYQDLGRHDEAEPLHVQSLAGMRRILGDEHPTTLNTMAHLALLYTAQERDEAARPLVEALIASSLAVARAEGATASEKNDCAWTLLTCRPADLRDPPTALELALEADEMTDHENPGFLDTLSLAYHLTGDTARAIENQRQAIALLPPGDSPLRAGLEAALAEFEAALAGQSD